MPLWQQLKTRRLELRLTVKECAKSLKIDPKTLRGWEGGTHEPSPEHKRPIARFLSERGSGKLQKLETKPNNRFAGK